MRLRVSVLNEVGHSTYSNYSVFFTTADPSPPLPVSNIEVHEVFGSSVVISWDKPTDLGGVPLQVWRIIVLEANLEVFRIVKKKCASNLTCSTHTEVFGLDTEAMYRIKIIAVTSAGSSEASSLSNEFTTGALAPPEPPVPFLSLYTSQFAQLVWPAVRRNNGDSVTCYRIYNDGSCVAEVSHIDEQIIATVGNVAVPGTLSLNITSVNTYGESRPANVATSLTSEGAQSSQGLHATGECSKWSNSADASFPGRPTNVRIVSLSASGVELMWTTPSDNGGSSPTAYIVEYSTEEAGAKFVTLESVSLSCEERASLDGGKEVTSLIVGKLEAATAYKFRVRSRNVVGLGEPSDNTPTHYTKAASIPTPPVAIQQVSATWSTLEFLVEPPADDNGSPVTSCSVQCTAVETSASHSKEFATTSGFGSGVVVLISDLTGSTEYVCRSRAANSVGYSMWGNSIKVTTNKALPPLVVPQLQILGVGSDFVTISWGHLSLARSRGAHVQNYIITVSDRNADSSPITQIFSVPTESTFGPGHIINFTVSGLLSRKQYSTFVTASNAAGRGATNGPLHFVTGDPSPPMPPTNVVLSDPLSSSILLRWSTPSGLGGIDPLALNLITYEYSCSGVGSWCPTVDGTTSSSRSSWRVSGLGAQCSYTCGMYTITNGTLKSEIALSKALVTAPGMKPGMPGRPHLLSVNGEVAVLKWSAPLPDRTGGRPIIGYELSVSEDSNLFMKVTDVKFDGLTGTVYGILAETPYFFAVSAINDLGVGDLSLPSPVINTGTPVSPSIVRNISVTFERGGSIMSRLTWHSPENNGGVAPSKVSYDVETYLLGSVSDMCSSRSISSYSGEAVTEGIFLPLNLAKVSNLPFATVPPQWREEGNIEFDYDIGSSSRTIDFATVIFYRVRARTSTVLKDGNRTELLGPWSAEYYALAPASVPQRPAPPRVSTVQHDRVTLKWRTPAPQGCDTDSYVLMRYTEEEGHWLEPLRISIESKSTSYVDVDLRRTTRYRWTVIAVNTVGESFPSEFSKITLTSKTSPSAVCSIYTSDISPTSVTVNWDKPCDNGGDLPSYQIQISEKQVNYAYWIHLPSSSSSQTYTHTNMDFDAEFKFRVRAYNSIGYGPWNITTVRTHKPYPCQTSIPGKKCSGNGECHRWDGTCLCSADFYGKGCEYVNGEKVKAVLSTSIELFNKKRFAEVVSNSLRIELYRVPLWGITAEAGSVKVSFYILNSRNDTADGSSATVESRANVSSNDLVKEFATLAATGDLVQLSVTSVTATTEHLSEPIQAPPPPRCDSFGICGDCVSKKGCGWCQSTGVCVPGGALGPSLGSENVCRAESWTFSKVPSSCPPPPSQVCGANSDCNSCLKEKSTKCGWCASRGKCLAQVDLVKSKCPWGLTDGMCSARCLSTSFKVSMKDYIWLGADTHGSQLFYRPRVKCKWVIAPGSERHDSRSRSQDVDSMTVKFHRVDLGIGDTIKVFDNTQSSTRKLYEFTSRTKVDYPYTLHADSGYVVIDFTSDAGTDVGTGFLAEYEGFPRPLLDTVSIVAIILMSLVLCTCCLCCAMKCCSRNPDDVVIENEFGVDLRGTYRGANLSTIQKFPEFSFTTGHLEKMVELGHETGCSICLGDYEEGEKLRLLTCGHCFHSSCVDAWLQINSICPMCKADVKKLAAEEAAQRKMDKKLNKKKRKKKPKSSIVVDSTHPSSAPESPVKPAEIFRRRARDLLTLGQDTDQSRTLWEKSRMVMTRRKPQETSGSDLNGNGGIELGVVEHRIAEHATATREVAGASKFDDEDDMCDSDEGASSFNENRDIDRGIENDEDATLGGDLLRNPTLTSRRRRNTLQLEPLRLPSRNSENARTLPRRHSMHVPSRIQLGGLPSGPQNIDPPRSLSRRGTSPGRLVAPVMGFSDLSSRARARAEHRASYDI